MVDAGFIGVDSFTARASDAHGRGGDVGFVQRCGDDRRDLAVALRRFDAVDARCRGQRAQTGRGSDQSSQCAIHRFSTAASRLR
jgi:hypothetical protein